MSDESPGATIRRARQEAHMKQRELADRMRVHVTTVGYWERDKFFPEQHWAALNKLLHISLTPPGAAPSEPEPIPADVLAVIKKHYSPEQQAEVIETLRAIEREQRGEAQSPPERHVG